MPTPFPGMDPYLERRAYWREIHLQLIAELARKLNPILRPRYRVATEQHTYTLTLMGTEERIGMPDVMVVDRDSPRAVLQPLSTTITATPTTVELPMPERVIERYLEVRDVENGDVITAIEILSPTNKVMPDGRRQYEKKRLQVLGSQTNLVEIDLLRSGRPMTMHSLASTQSDYRIWVSRAPQRPQGDVYLFGVRTPIPLLPIPLRPGEPEPSVDLNMILHELYDLLNYDLVLDYRKDAQPKLEGKDAAWADALLREHGLRS
jgi:hypothetical protein